MIPKTIHYCWFGDNPKPKSVIKCIKSWKKFCPDYKIIEWNEKNYDIHKNEYLEQAYEAKKWGFVSDYARLDILFHFGGIYLDTDVQLLKSLDGLLKYDSFFGFEQNDTRIYVNTGLGCGAISNHPIIKKLMDAYASLSFVKEDGTLNTTPCPQLNSKVLKDCGFRIDNTTQIKCNDIVFSSEYFAPKSYISGFTVITKNTYSIHHYEASWFTEEEQSKKLDRWERYRNERSKAKKEKFKSTLKHLPNIITMRILGKSKYEKLKKIIKKN